MNRFFKTVALFALISCAVWIAVLWHWQATVRDISTRDIVTYLVFLPGTLFVFALMLRWAWIGIAAKQVQRNELAAASAAATNSGAPDTQDTARHATVQLIAAHLVCAAGSSAGELQSAAKDGAPRPTLDPELRDDEGFPVVSARIKDLDVTALDSLFAVLLPSVQAIRPEWAHLAPGEHVLRALAALESPLSDAIGSVLPWSAKFAPEPLATGGGGTVQEPGQERRVRVLLGWPADWTLFEQELGRACADEWLASSGTGVFAARCFAVSAHACSGEDLLLHADRLTQALAREGRDDPVIVAACHSAISEVVIDGLGRSGSLFGSARPKGHIPAEAAAALLLAPAQWSAAPDGEGPFPHLCRPALLRRDKSVDAAGRIDGNVLAQTVDQALTNGRVNADALAGAVCDADLHTARAAEFYGASVELLPALDSAEDMRLLGTITGAVGVVSPLLVIACAAERAAAVEKPQLAVTLGDAFARLALVVFPASPPVPESAANPAAEAGTKEASA